MTVRGSMMRIARDMLLGLTLVLFGWMATGLAGGTAQAQITVNPLICTGTSQDTFSPPLTNTTQPTQDSVSTSFPVCVSTDGSGITSGYASYQITRDYSCTQLFAGKQASREFHWSNGQTSTFSYSSVVNLVGGNFTIVLTGTMTAGRYVGQSVVEVLALTDLNQANFLTGCASSGIAQVSGTDTLTVLPAL